MVKVYPIVLAIVLCCSACVPSDPDSGDYDNLPFTIYLDNTDVKSVDISKDGFVYVTGNTANPSLGGGSGGVYEENFTGNGSVFIRKFAPDGSTCRGTYLSLGNSESIACDSEGNVIVGGATNNVNWPTKNAYQDTYHPGSAGNCFMTKLGPDLKKMFYSTFIGGGSQHADDSTNGWSVKTIRVDSDDNAIFLAAGQDMDMPLGKDGLAILGNPLLVGYNIWPMEYTYGYNMYPPVWSRVVVGMMSADGDYTGLNLGGYEPDTSSGALAVDDNGVYIGARCKAGGPLLWATVYGSYRTTTHQTGQAWFDGAVAKISSNLRSPIYSTYLGGTHQNDMMSAVVDSGCLIVAGKTRAGDYPTKNPIQGHNNGDYDMVITKFNGTGTALEFSTYLGTSGYDEPKEIRQDEAKRLWIVGKMNSRATLVRISSDLQRVEEWRDLGNGEVTGLAIGDGCIVYTIRDNNVSRVTKELM